MACVDGGCVANFGDEGTLEGVEGIRDVCEGWRRYERVGREELDSGI